jgi:lipoprotein NlpD
MSRFLLPTAFFILVLGGCSGAPPAPVEERSTRPVTAGLEADGRYRVRRGDTLFAIAFDFGLDYRNLAHWNNIASPYVIYPDQLLHLNSPPRPASTKAQTAESGKSPAKSPVKAGATVTAKATPRSTTTKAPVASTTKPPPKPVSKPAQSDPRSWVWPTEGRLLRTFSATDPSRKGIEITGNEGQPVRAAAPGTVVYSGSGLIGYGELIIIKHSESLLSAYAHNRVRLVQEGATIKSGEKIAEMGQKDSKRSLLHFEIRLNGKPVDPLKYLPKQSG